MKKPKIGEIVTYNCPALLLVRAARTAKGKVIRYTKSGKNILVEDVEIQSGETQLYEHYIALEQIVS